jgi:hypothetical protein
VAQLPAKMRPSEAADYLRVGKSFLAKLRCYGGGPRFAKVGPRFVIYDKADLDSWLASRTFRDTADYRGQCPIEK